MIDLETTVNRLDQLTTPYGFQTSPSDERICTQVNGLAALSLAELGKTKEAQTTMQRLLQSNAYDETTQLFHRKISSENTVLQSQYNTCKNAATILGLNAAGYSEQAEKTAQALLNHEPLWEGNLLYRGHDESKGTDTQVITHSNLWAALALEAVGKDNIAQKITKALRAQKEHNGLLRSHNYQSDQKNQRLYTGDQGLYATLLQRLDKQERANDVLKQMIQAPSHDSNNGLWRSHFNSEEKSTYKNALLGRALLHSDFDEHTKKLQHNLSRLYDPNNKLFKRSTKQASYEVDTTLLALTVTNNS